MRTETEQAQLEAELAIEFLKLYLEDLYIEEYESSGSFQLEQPGDHSADAARYMIKPPLPPWTSRKVCASPCMEGKRRSDGTWTGPCSCYPNAGGRPDSAKQAYLANHIGAAELARMSLAEKQEAGKNLARVLNKCVVIN